ncbi:hypothetical protein DMP17_01565 [Pseudonocardia sp. TMWB2A]|uniref:hypothetical protein n=1 Tax=Pseudonocardia sp. TMWB2A TaxID=687430 RepID=UPI00307FA7F5
MTKFGIITGIAALALLGGCGGDEPGDMVDEGKGQPRSGQEIVVENGLKTVPNVVIDDKGNPVLNNDGTPKMDGQKPGPVYNGDLPKALEGAWAINAADCARGSGETRIRVGARQVIFYEAQAKVKKVEQAGDVTIADMDISAEGQASVAEHKFSLADGGKTLVYERGGEVYRYHKCAV